MIPVIYCLFIHLSSIHGETRRHTSARYFGILLFEVVMVTMTNREPNKITMTFRKTIQDLQLFIVPVIIATI